VYITASSDNNIIENNTISENFDDGVYIEFSSNNIVVDNTILADNTISEDYVDGVHIRSSSSYNTVENNTILGGDHGVFIASSSNNNKVVNNTIWGNDYGVYIVSSSDTMLFSNIFVNNGICILGNEVEYWRHNIATDNLVNGKILGYFWNLNSGTIDGTQYGQVTLANCT